MGSYKDFPDAKLIVMLKQRDKLAFAEIHDRYSMVVYYKANRMLGDKDTAKDMVQDIFTSLWEKAGDIHDEGNLAGYLFIATRNSVLKLIQKGKTKDEYLSALGKYSEEVSYDMLERLDERELMALVLQEIEKLPPKMREVFQLSRLEHLSHKEIAMRLNISEATVRQQVKNSIRVLRGRLTKYGSYGIVMLAMLRH